MIHLARVNKECIATREGPTRSGSSNRAGISRKISSKPMRIVGGMVIVNNINIHSCMTAVGHSLINHDYFVV